MVDVVAILLEREVVDPLTFLGGAERAERQDLRLAAGEQAGAVRPRCEADLDVDRADLLRATTVGPPLVDGDLLADDVLVDRVGRLLDPRLRRRVLLVRLSVGDREREVDVLDDVVVEHAALAGLEVLRVLLGVGQLFQVALELLAHRAFDGDEALLVEHEREPALDLHLLHHVVLGGVERDVGADLVDDLADDRLGGLQALRLDALPDRVAVRRLELCRQRRVDPLRLANLLTQIVDDVADALDLGVGELEREQHRVFRDLVGAGLDHRQRVARSDHDQVEIGILVGFLQRRVDDELAVDPGDAHCAHRAEERQRRDRERRGGAVDAEDVVAVDHVRREDGADDLHLVPEALRPERPDRAVDHPRGQGRPLGRLAFAL